MNSPHLPCTSLPSPQAKIRKNTRERQIVWVRRSNNEVQIPSSPLLGDVLPWLQTLHFVFLTPGWLWISDMHIGKLSIFSSVAQSSDFLPPHGLQYTRLPCPSPTPGACSNACPSSRWCHPTISSSVVPFCHLQSFPASGSFLVSQFFTSGGQSLRVSALASVIPMNIQDWFPLEWIGWISLRSKGLF